MADHDSAEMPTTRLLSSPPPAPEALRPQSVSSPPTPAPTATPAHVVYSSTHLLSSPLSSPPTPCPSRAPVVHSHLIPSTSSHQRNSTTKGRHAEPGTTEAHSERASISMPPHTNRHSTTSRPVIRSRTSSSVSTISTSSRRRSLLFDTWFDGAIAHEESAIDDHEYNPRHMADNMSDSQKQSPLPEPTSRPRNQTGEADQKRISVSSIYSLSSARAGGPSNPASAAGSEHGTRSVSQPLSPTKAFAAQPETGTSAISVTTTNTQLGGSHASSHTANPKEATTPTSAPSDATRRTATSRADASDRIPPTRSRSRAKRRFSGSTAASHSPSSSERGLLSKASKEDVKKPAPLGIIGVCALDVKARSKPSRNILNRLIKNGEFEVIVFGDKVILDEEVQNWPICDYLISFYSDGFPLDKAIAYVKARKPFCVNDVPMQQILWDRRICLRILDKINVPTPKRLEVNRDGGPSIETPELARHLKETTGVTLEGPENGTGGQVPPPRKVELLDDGDTLCVDGALLKKPFVEKPVSGEDHNICIYYPKSQGGGARKLFRKIGNKSSEWVDGLTIPRAITEEGGSYLYEQFMRVDNAEDVKAYTVGPNFCHAETRKSPVVDGLVRRNTHGKEVRYITALTDEEKAMASRIATSFGQRVCGFDLLRADGKSYVIDVNGWSFVKDNEEYYNQCANIMRDLFIKEKQSKSGQQTIVTNMPPPAVPESEPLSAKADSIGRDHHHRSALQNIISKSPSMSKLSGHIHRKGHDSPDLTGSTTSLTSPPSIERDGSPSLPSVPNTPLLPPPTQSLPPHATPDTMPGSPTIPAEEEVVLPPPAPKHTWKLKGMVSVIRHADRTPKQKYKFTFHTRPFIELLKGHQEEVLLTGEAALDSVTSAVDVAMKEGIEDKGKLKTLRSVLIKKGGWAGTKVQIKPMFRKRNSDEMPPAKVADQIVPAEIAEENKATEVSPVKDEVVKPENGAEVKDGEERRMPRRNDSLSGTTLSRITAAEESLVLDKLQLIVKWGGEPTHSARYQAQELGDNMRNDLLLMNREVLDEVHVFSSSERRVTTSAQIWASSFLAQKNLPSDYITIRKDLLDDSNAAKDEMDKVKKRLKTLLREGEKPPSQFAWPANMPEPSIVQKYVVQLMHFHRRVMRHNYNRLYGGATSSLSAIANPSDKISSDASSNAMSQANATNSIQSRWCCGEDAELFKERWEKLFSEFCDGDKVDPSKISELYDTMKFDALHNRQFLEWVFTPSKSILEEESAEMEELKASEKEHEDNKTDGKSDKARAPDDIKVDKNQTQSAEKPDANKAKRGFRRRSMMLPSKTVEDPPEQYFNLFTGNSQTKAKTDARLERLRELYKLAKVLFDFICPQEYGITNAEKLEIGLLTSLPLLKEIVQDLEEMQASDDAKSFIYFTKESHIYTLLNCILEGGIETKISRSAIPELDYLSQICFELYESENKVAEGAPVEEVPTFTYSIRITISPGCHTFDPLDVQLDSKHCIGYAQRRSLTPHGEWKYVIETLRAKFHQVKLPKSFLAVNLSESHTFHKKEDVDEGVSTIAEMEAKKDEQKNVEASLAGDRTNGNATTDADTPVSPDSPVNVTSTSSTAGPATGNDEETQIQEPKSE